MDSDDRLIITIDGPVASGKSTVAKQLAEKLGIYYLGTGLMFRGAAYILMHKFLYKKDDLAHLNREDFEAFLKPQRFVYKYKSSREEQLFFDGCDLTPLLKTRDMDEPASIVSTNRDVRKMLLEIQRMCAEKHDIVAEGRDVGSVVFPQASCKFFLTASVGVRADRWKADRLRKRSTISRAQAIAIITERDKRDREREVAPLIKPADAVEIDNSDLNLSQTVQWMQNFILQKRA